MKRRSSSRDIAKRALRRNLQIESLESRLAFSIWSPVELSALSKEVVPHTRVTNFELFSLDTTELLNSIDEAPHEFSGQQSNVEISIPNPRGHLERFVVYSSPIMEPGLAAAFPNIQTFAGQGIDNPSASLRFDVTPIGFHAQVLSSDGAYYVDPYSQASLGLYASYFKSENVGPTDFVFHPPVIAAQDDNQTNRNGEGEPSSRSGTQLREYRLAVAATGEYTLFHAGRNPGVPAVQAGQAAIVTAINRVAGVYRQELSVTFVLVANNQSLVFTDPATDPYTNNNGFTMLGENQRTIDTIIGNANYDIGHVFSTGGGGVASLGSVGINSRKAQGVTGLPAPIDDAFYIDYVAHEVGHQFGGNHSFNGVAGACGARNASTAYEPGSGTTIMAYAGICGADDLQPNSDPFFHSISFDEAIRHVDTVIPNVGRRIATGNSVPTVNAGADFVIPARTPFVLTASGTDANATDVLTFGWEQRDLGPAQNITAADNGTSPLFRFWSPTVNNSRYFPRLSDLVNNRTAAGERLPTTSRNMNFRAVVRDNRFSGGGVNTDDMLVRVIDTGTPFAVTQPNTAVSWTGLSSQTITWAVANTDVAPISTSLVDVFLSTDGGLTYPITVAQGVPNSGQANIFVPNVDTTQGRIMVRGSNNIFFDISDADFTIVSVPLVLTVAPATSTYVENSPPILLAGQSTVTVAQTLNGLRMDVSIISGVQTGDQLSVSSANGISQQGNNLFINGTVIASILASTSRSLAMQLSPNAAIGDLQALIRSIAFANSTDNPRAVTRTVEFVFAGALRQSVDITVIPTNDPPVLSAMSLVSIPEDLVILTGQAMSQFTSNAFSDPDENSRLTGVVVVGNPQNAQEGSWQYSTGSNWFPIGPASNTAGLVLSRTSRIGFLPAPDYFGTPQPLRLKALDDTYTGSFTSAGLRVIYNPSDGLPTSISVADAPLSIQVINVNDPPIANSPQVEINVLQDQTIDTVLDASLFTDIDSPLTWSLESVSSNFPRWLSFDPQSRLLSGTPLNGDVGDYNLRLVASDGEFRASIPLIIRVININDPPEQLRLVGGEVDEGRAGIQIGTLFAVDPDGDSVFWSSSDARFVIRDGQVILNTAVDFELEPLIPVTFRARDSGSPPLSSTLDVVIKVRDVNEFYPQLRGQVYRLIDGTPAATLIDTLDAPDNDFSQTVRYRLVSGDVADFDLDQQTGELRLARAANLREKAAYKVFIEAFDDGVPSFSTTAQFEVRIDPANFFAPEFDENQVLIFAENLPADTLVGRVAVTDRDGNPLRYRLVSVGGGSVNWVNLDPVTGDVRLTEAHRFDFEALVDYSLEVEVQEMLDGGNTVTGTVPIRLLNRNDRPSALGNLTIYPNRFGTPVTTAFAVTDQDPSIAGYTFSTQDSRFEIRSGRLALKPTEFLTSSFVGQTLNVLVRVTDIGDPSSFADLMAPVSVVAAAAWQNPINPLDVNRDRSVTSSDALLIINRLNDGGSIALTVPRPFEDLSLPDVDVSGNDFLSPSDALQIINFLNARTSPEGESRLVEPNESPLDSNSEAWLLAYNQIDEERLNRRRR